MNIASDIGKNIDPEKSSQILGGDVPKHMIKMEKHGTIKVVIAPNTPQTNTTLNTEDRSEIQLEEMINIQNLDIGVLGAVLVSKVYHRKL